ncbi:YcaO-like family protein [Haloarcula sp. S1CR25-12]|uniref:YcaO-like family protein n=1 Tax=Haloarcula saliterrae TaxID=2950534 RepID=A0ABU2F7G9_9EURY|nr:YcaO-like family protein [Haloarcula sp. S1CR25-12]MDS0258208.1 YcaO-like family protein [Haloarcula sp. S1CR25-12]
MTDATDRVVRAGRTLTDPSVGVFRRVRTGATPADEPRLHTAAVDRAHPAAMTDGVFVPPSEGGAALTPRAALTAAIGEGVERYSAAIYRDRDLREDAYGALDNAVDPADVVTFAPEQRAAGTVPPACYERGDELRWVAGERATDGTTVQVPAQLVYLSYDTRDRPFVRAPISTGLAAGLERAGAVRRGLLEVVERDAFMLYYLTESPLPSVRVPDRDGPVGTLCDRLDRAGIDWRLLDARTDLGIPVVVAVLVDRHGLPEVSVAAAAAVDASGAAQSALEEAIQTRRYQQHLRARTEERPSLSALSPAEVGREERLLAWSERGAAAELPAWTDTESTTTPAEIDAETGPLDASDVVPTVTDTWDVYTVDVTTRDVAAAGFTVVRVLAPAAQPLYLSGAHRYWGGDRLSTVPVDRGYSSASPAPTDLNDCPHPFP